MVFCIIYVSSITNSNYLFISFICNYNSINYRVYLVLKDLYIYKRENAYNNNIITVVVEVDQSQNLPLKSDLN